MDKCLIQFKRQFLFILFKLWRWPNLRIVRNKVYTSHYVAWGNFIFFKKKTTVPIQAPHVVQSFVRNNESGPALWLHFNAALMIFNTEPQEGFKENVTSLPSYRMSQINASR